LFYFNNSGGKLIYYVIKLEPDSDNKPSPAEYYTHLGRTEL